MHHAQYPAINKNTGMVLIEVMLAVSLSLLIAGMLTKIYFSMHQTFARQHALEIHHGIAQKVMDILTDEIRMAGYIGCATLSSDFLVTPSPPHTLTSENNLMMDDQNITIRYQSFPNVVLVKNMEDKSRLVTDTSIRYRAGQFLLISDCMQAEIFKADSVTVESNIQMIVAQKPLHHLYRQNAEVGQLIMHHYYLGKSHHEMRSHSLVYALMRADGDGGKHKVVNGINHLSFSREAKGVYISFGTTEPPIERPWRLYVASDSNRGDR